MKSEDSTIIISFLSVPGALKKLAAHVRAGRLAENLTQEGLAVRAGVSLATLRKFEQKGLISLESFVKLLAVLRKLEAVVNAAEPEPVKFRSIDGVITLNNKPVRKKGRRK